MKKITKLFVVILSISSFVLSTAGAGELSVTGGATATYKIGGADASTGKGIGVSNEIDFTANGELDNGFTWKWQTQLDDATTQNDDTRLEIGTGYGTVGFYISENDLSSKFGYGVGAMGPGSDYAGPSTVEHGVNMGSYNNIGYATPSGLLPNDVQIKVAYAPNLAAVQGASAKADGVENQASVGSNATQIKITATPAAGLSVGADYMTVGGSNNLVRYSQESGGAFAKYVSGPLTIGAARSIYQPTEGKTAAGGASTLYETNMYGAQFAVNDNLSVSYSEERSAKQTTTSMSTTKVITSTDDIVMKIQHLQAAYVYGGATLGVAIAEADDADYTVSKKEKTTTFSVAMAF